MEGTATFFCLEFVDGGKLFELNASMGMNVVDAANRKAMEVAAESHGEVVSTLGEYTVLLVAFPFASKCVEAASAINRHLLSHAWYPSRHLVRSAVVTGEVEVQNQEFLGTIAALAGLARAGQILVDEATRAVVRKNLSEGHGFLNLGMHHLEDLSRGQSLFQLLHPDLPGEFQLLPSLLEAASNLPTGGTRFIGRVHELSEVKEGFYQSRVVSLVGFGGVGKTRLAIQVATELLEDHYHGACYFDLGGIRTLEQLYRTMSAALTVKESVDLSPEHAILEHLRSREMLLVFDNLDEVLHEVSDVIAQIINLCPRVQILTTSRQMLRLDIARHVTVAPMETPGAGAYSDLELTLIDSVSLFVSRAQLVDEDFALNSYTSKLVAAICTRLEGIPLAIEIAAAQTRRMGLAEISQNLTDRFELLSKKARGRGALDTALHWSFDRLSEEQKCVLRSLVPFAGEFTFESALLMASGPDRAESQTSEILDELASLAYVQSLEFRGRRYFRLLDTVREFVRASIGDKRIIEEYMDRHAAVFYERSRKVLIDIYGEKQTMIMEELDRTYRNYLLALDWLTAQPRDERPQEFIRALYTYWYYRAMYEEGIKWTEEVLGTKPLDPVMKGKLHIIAGTLYSGKYDYSKAAKHFKQAAKLANHASDLPLAIAAYASAGTMYGGAAKYREAKMSLEKALEISVRLERESDEADNRNNLALVLLDSGNHELARHHALLSKSINERLKLPIRTANNDFNLGRSYRLTGEFDRAAFHFELALKTTVLKVQTAAFRELAYIRVALGAYHSAAILFGADEAIRTAKGIELMPSRRTEYYRNVNSAKGALGTRYAFEHQKGFLMTLTEIHEFLLVDNLSL